MYSQVRSGPFHVTPVGAASDRRLPEAAPLRSSGPGTYLSPLLALFFAVVAFGVGFGAGWGGSSLNAPAPPAPLPSCVGAFSKLRWRNVTRESIGPDSAVAIEDGEHRANPTYSGAGDGSCIARVHDELMANGRVLDTSFRRRLVETSTSLLATVPATSATSATSVRENVKWPSSPASPALYSRYFALKNANTTLTPGHSVSSTFPGNYYCGKTYPEVPAVPGAWVFALVEKAKSPDMGTPGTPWSTVNTDGWQGWQLCKTGSQACCVFAWGAICQEGAQDCSLFPPPPPSMPPLPPPPSPPPPLPPRTPQPSYAAAPWWARGPWSVGQAYCQVHGAFGLAVALDVSQFNAAWKTSKDVSPYWARWMSGSRPKPCQIGDGTAPSGGKGGDFICGGNTCYCAPWVWTLYSPSHVELPDKPAVAQSFWFSERGGYMDTPSYARGPDTSCTTIGYGPSRTSTQGGSWEDGALYAEKCDTHLSYICMGLISSNPASNLRDPNSLFLRDPPPAGTTINISGHDRGVMRFDADGNGLVPVYFAPFTDNSTRATAIAIPNPDEAMLSTLFGAPGTAAALRPMVVAVAPNDAATTGALFARDEAGATTERTFVINMTVGGVAASAKRPPPVGLVVGPG